jgi:hypothetical protein
VLHSLAPAVAAAASGWRVTVAPGIEIDLLERPLADHLAEPGWHRPAGPCTRDDAPGYRVEPVQGCHHAALGVALLLRASPTSVLHWLAASDPQWLAWAIAEGGPGGGAAETTSSSGAVAGAVAGRTAAPARIDPDRIRLAMHQLIASGRWTVNRKRARLWQVDGALHLVWKTAARELIEILAGSQAPPDPDGMLETMISAGIVAGCADRPAGAMHTIATPHTDALDVVALCDPDHWLRALARAGVDDRSRSAPTPAAAR